jgi:hypothetical protein
MNRFAVAFLLFSLAIVNGCGLGSQDFSAPDGAYKIKFPATPGRVYGTGPGLRGDFFEARTGGWAYGVGMCEMPNPTARSTPTAALNFNIQEMARNTGGILTSQTPITVNGFPGIEGTIQISKGRAGAETMILRIYVVNRKLAIVTVNTNHPFTRETPEAKAYFDSFVVTATASGGGPIAPMHGTMSPAYGSDGSAPAMHGGGSPGVGMHGATPGTYSTGGANGTPSGTYNSGGSSSAASPAAGMHGASASTGVAGTPMPTGTYNTGVPAPAGTAGSTGSSPQNGAQAGMHGAQPGVAGSNGSTPVFTGIPVTLEHKLYIGDFLQVFLNRQWVDVKVQQTFLDGSVQVRTQVKPQFFFVTFRNVLQYAPGVMPTLAPVVETPRSKGASYPITSTASLPTTTRPISPSKPAAVPSTAKSEPAKGGFISLDDASIEDLLKIMGTKTEHRRVQAAEKLAERSDAGPNPEVAKKLADFLKVDELTVRAAAAKTLEKWASPEVYDVVLKNLNASTTEVRQSMMRILAANRVEGSAAEIGKRLADKDDRKVAQESLIAFGEAAQAAVISLLDSKEQKVKLAACDILKEIGSADAVTALKKAVETWSGTDRIAARKTLQIVEAKK